MADNRDDRRNRWQGFDLGGGPDGPRRWRFTLLYVLLGFILLAVVNQALFGPSQEIPYSRFIERVEAGDVARVAISDTTVTGEFRGGETFTTTRPPIEDPDLDEFLKNNDVEFTGEQPSDLATFLFSWILPILILVALWGFVFRRMAGGGAASALNLGRRGVKIYDRKDLKTTFADVAGVDEAVDELDTIGKTRAGAMGAGMGSHDEREQTLNQLLVEMDGFDASKGVIIMAATNRPDVLDPALIRPGRFDRQVVVDLPDLNGREEILRVHARGVALDPTVDLKTIAARTPGFTGADLENVVNEAALLAARREKNAVTMKELEEAIDRATAGLERKSRVVSDKQKERVAVHEMGHALVALKSPEIDPLHRVTIIPRGAAALGITMTRPLEDRYVVTEPQLKDQLAFAMGGQAAEEIYFDGVISTGAQNDLEKATDLARAMVSQFGMSDAVGPISLGRDDPNAWLPRAMPKVSDHTAGLIDKEVRRLLDEAHVRAERILQDNRDLLNRLSALLIATEVIDGDVLKAYA